MSEPFDLEDFMSSPQFEVGPPDRDLYLKAGGVPYLKLTTAGVLTAINSGSISGVTNSGLVTGGVGSWTNVAHSQSNYTASGSMTWTVDLADQATYQWTRVGNIVTVQLFVTQTTVGGTPSTTLIVALPAGLTVVNAQGGTYHYLDNSTAGIGLWAAVDGATAISFFKMDFSGNWAASTNATHIRATVQLRVS